MTRPAILVIDDEPEIRRLFQLVLAREPYDVLTAEGGPEALTLLESAAAPLSLVIIDYVMPGMNGGELAKRISRMCPQVPLLLMSGALVMTLPVNVAGFLKKPLDWQEVHSTVNKLVFPPGA